MTAGRDRIDAIVDRLAADAAERVVIEDARRRWSGLELRAAVDALAAALAGRGVRGGDRVVLINENACETVALLFALARLDAWAVLVNARLTAHEIAAIREHCEPRLDVYTVAASDAAAAHAERAGAEELDVPAVPGLAAMATRDAEPEPVAADGARQVAVLIYTSGTTGRPKGVMLSHRNIAFVAQTSGRVRRLSPADVVYGVLPISHVFGLASVYLGSLAHGARLLTVPRFDAAEAARALAEDGITVFQAVPAIYARLLELATERGAPLPAPSLRYLSAGGAPLDLRVKQRIEAMWGGALHNGYGLTETAPTVSTTRTEAPSEGTDCGPPLPGVEVRVHEPGADGVGELWVRGPNVMLGYYRDPDLTREVLTGDGWCRTGDLARIDARSNIHIVGRARELIIRSGFNVYPPEVEAAIGTHPDVALCAVLGRRTADGNEDVIAFVQPRRGARLDVEQLRAHLTERLAPYKRPTEIRILETLPATPAGKVLKARLRDLLMAEAAR